MSLSRLATAGSAALAFALAGCDSESPASPDLSPSLGVTRGGGEGQYILSAAGTGLPAALDRSVQQAGGRLVAVYPQVGLAIARSAGWDFPGKAERISGIHQAIPDQRFRWQAPTRVHRLAKPTP